MNTIELLYIDLFCGAGGTSSGVEYATVDDRKCAEVIACVNHDANAIKSHAANHPKTMHFTEDIRTLDLAPLVRHLQKMKRKPVREVLDLDDEGESIFAKKKPLCEKTLERIYAGLIKFVAGGKERHEAWILKYNSTNQDGHHNPPSIDEPCPTVAVQNRLGLVKTQFLSKQFSGDPMSKNQGIDRPAGTVTCKDHHAFVTAYYGGSEHNYSIDKPAPTVTTKDRIALVTSHYLMNPQFASAGGSIDKPCFTLIARMDKMPPYLVSTEQGVGIAIYEDDSPMTRKVKEFMAMYGIIDIKMRMLIIVELKRIMGFPENYTLIGTQAEQKKFIGNAVEVNMSRVLCEALARKLMVKAA